MKMDFQNRKFNFCAALFRELWLAYHFMFIEFFIVCFVNLVINVIVNLWIIWNGKRIAGYVPFLLLITIYVTIFILFGKFGNQILDRNIRGEKQKHNGTWTYSYCIQLLRKNEKSIVFRGTSVVVCAVIIILIDAVWLPVILDWFLY